MQWNLLLKKKQKNNQIPLRKTNISEIVKLIFLDSVSELVKVGNIYFLSREKVLTYLETQFLNQKLMYLTMY